jgi:omega-amidase
MSVQDLNVTLIQSDLHWENPVANLAMFEEEIWKIGQSTDVIVLPEMFPTGFSMNAQVLAEAMNLRTFKWMKQMAQQTGALMLGSFIAKENSDHFNRLLWMEPNGTFKTYDKRHLFRMAEEHKVYSPGKGKLLEKWKGWNICPLVCYDLRFPVWSRNTWENNSQGTYDLLVYVANWPKARVTQWDTLLKARAIENLSYVVGVNRIGDGNGVAYNGHSAVIDPKGDLLFGAGETAVIKTVKLSYEELHAYRTRFPAYLDADKFTIQ